MVNPQGIWKELNDFYSHYNSPHIYLVRRDIAMCSKDNKSVASYFTIVQSMWNELSSLLVFPTCSYSDSFKTFTTYHEQEYLIDFLMGYNDSYNSNRGQIFLINMLPNVNRAYALILYDKKQRLVVVLYPSIFY